MLVETNNSPPPSDTTTINTGREGTIQWTSRIHENQTTRD